MPEIISNQGSIILNDNQSLAKGTFRVSVKDDMVFVHTNCGSNRWELKTSETTVDGESFTEPKDLLAKLANFSRGGGSTGEGVQSVGVGPGLSVDDSDPNNPVINLERQGVSDDIVATGDGEMNQQIVYDTGISDLNSAVVTAKNEGARENSFSEYTVVNGVITITVPMAPDGVELTYSYAALAGAGAPGPNPGNYVTQEQLTERLFEQSQVLPTYQEMIDLLPLNYNADFLVLEDENKGQQNTTYKYYSQSNTLMWYASVKEELS